MSFAHAKPLAELLEHELTEQVIGTKTNPGIARQVGFRVYHTYRSKRSEPGWPDWALVRERFITLELKTVKGKVSGPQKDWGRDLLRGGVEFYILRPADLDDIARILACRGDPYMRRDLAEIAARLREKTRKECE